MTFLLPLMAALLKEDPELARRLKNRDPQAMAELYDRYGRVMFALIFRVVRNEAVAEDLVQESFLRIWNRVHAFDHEKGSLGPWVLAVARNRAIDYLRSVDGRMAQNALELEKLEQPALFVDLENGILNLDRVRKLRGAFEKLSQNQRLVLELAYWEGFSQTEISDRLKQPLGTVKTWIRTGLKVLRQELGGAAA
ncbi:MAG: sigma-70 family RNA polymerase sigma factor [Bryobacteraceae bacterium]|jgi:RNA polymerase sigma-70 factor (ECF subfamily)